MKLFSKLMAATVLVALASCSEDKGSADGGIVNPGESGIYSQLSFKLPTSRSTAMEGTEAGKEYENNVGSILVVLATEEPEGTYKFITYALNDSPISNSADSKHTIVFQDKDKLFAKAGTEVCVFAYCNPTEAIRTKVAGTLNATTGVYEGGLTEGSEFTDEICSDDIESTWSRNGFLMTSVDVKKVKLADAETLKTYNTPTNAFSLGTVEVIRTSCRFDFRDAAPEAKDKPLTYTVYDVNDESLAVADVKLTRVALFNLRSQFYYLPRTEFNSAINLCPTFTGMEDGFVLSPSTATYTETLPELIDPLNPTTDLKWISLDAVLGLEDDTDDNWTENVDPSEGYHIWRYATENTVTEVSTANTTGYVFESEIIPGDDFGNVADGKAGVMYLYRDKLFPSAMAIAAEIENVPVSTLATAFDAAFDLTRDEAGKVTAATPKSDDVVENMGFTAYKPNADGKYLAYYFAFNKHNDNEDPTSVGEMEYATVRNNVYKLAVTSVKKFGTFKPSEDVEEWDTYFTLDVQVKPWVVRVNNLDF